MLSPLAGSATFNPNYTASIEPHKPKPSPYEPPSDLKRSVLDVRTHPVLEKDDVKFSREIVWDARDPKKEPKIVSNRLVIETGDKADDIHVRSWPGDKLQILINGKSYVVDANGQKDTQQDLVIKTNGGNDSVIIDNDVKNSVDVEGGDGHDYMQSGGGRTRLYGGRGDDFMRLGSGLGYAEGNEGDDTMIGGTGNAVMYGNKGRDRMYGGLGSATKQSYLDGGDDADEIYSGNGHTVSHGGNGDDLMVGHDRTTFYTGKGNDRICNNRLKDRIYAGTNDVFQRNQGSTFREVKPSEAGTQAYRVRGGDGQTTQQKKDFEQRVNDDLEFLRSSPVGQQALGKMDEISASNGARINIQPASSGGSTYDFGSTELNNMSDEEFANAPPSKFGQVVDGVPGSRADLASINFARASVLESADRTNIAVPVTALFHEMAHGFNGATGTFLGGTTKEYPTPDKSYENENTEYQAVGIPNTAQPFDIDNNPSTPPTNINPNPFTENALNEEMGKPLRQFYKFSKSDQGQGN